MADPSPGRWQPLCRGPWASPLPAPLLPVCVGLVSIVSAWSRPRPPPGCMGRAVWAAHLSMCVKRHVLADRLSSCSQADSSWAIWPCGWLPPQTWIRAPWGLRKLASSSEADVEGQWGSFPLPSTLPGRVDGSTWGWQEAVHWGSAGLAGAAPPCLSQQPLLPTCAEPRGWALGVLDGAMCTAGGTAALALCNCSLLSSPQESLHQRPPEADSDQ